MKAETDSMLSIGTWSAPVPDTAPNCRRAGSQCAPVREDAVKPRRTLAGSFAIRSFDPHRHAAFQSGGSEQPSKVSGHAVAIVLDVGNFTGQASPGALWVDSCHSSRRRNRSDGRNWGRYGGGCG